MPRRAKRRSGSNHMRRGRPGPLVVVRAPLVAAVAKRSGSRPKRGPLRRSIPSRMPRRDHGADRSRKRILRRARVGPGRIGRTTGGTVKPALRDTPTDYPTDYH